MQKEQCVFWLGVLVIVGGGWCLWTKHPKKREQLEGAVLGVDHQLLRQQRAAYSMCLVAAGLILFILSMHSKMALNVRYALPALPALYLAIGIATGCLWQHWPVATRRLLAGCAVVIAVEVCCVFPHFFAYVNPLLGGSYSVPLVLHDSNFDGGQDVWRMEQAVAGRDWGPRKVYWYLNISFPAECLGMPVRTPPVGLIDRLIAARSDVQMTQESEAGRHAIDLFKRKNDWETVPAAVVISRGYQAPAPWTGSNTAYQRLPDKQLARLLSLPPDDFITPTLAVYYYSPDSQ